MNIRNAILVGTVLGALFWPALDMAQAHATDTDDVYVSVLAERGITHTSGDRAMVELGHAVCVDLTNGFTVWEEIKTVHAHSALSMADSGYLVGASQAAYCPWSM